MAETWSILKTSFDGLDVPRAAAVLAQCSVAPLAELTFRIRAGRGVLLRGLEKSIAETAARELTAAGIPAAAIPDRLTVPPAPPYQLRNANATAAGFFPIRETGPPAEALPWSQIRVIAVGRVQETEVRQRSAIEQRRRLSTAAGRRLNLINPSSAVSETHIRERLHLLGGVPLQHYWIEGGRFNYASILPHPAAVAGANFCLLVTGLLRMCTAALTNLLPEQIGEDGSLALEVFEDRHELDRTITWLAALAQVRASVGFSTGVAGATGDENRTVGMD